MYLNIEKYLFSRFEKNLEEFPDDKVNYAEKYKSLSDYMFKSIHENVMYGNIHADKSLLNDHGVDHVKMVMNRAYLLLNVSIENLTGYEIYILLLAIHFHDVGNIYGRDKHEEKIYDVINHLEDKFDMDTATLKYITKIAMAHGGRYNNSKDTISALNFKDNLQGKKIRPTLLAAILRLADEIADDKTRANRFLLSKDSLPEKNQVYHNYSASLQPVSLNEKTLVFKFDISEKNIINKLGKEDINAPNGVTKVYLYDEILTRLKKCLCELEYCTRFLGGIVALNTIQAEITVHRKKVLHSIYNDSLRLRLTGYPNTMSKDILDLLENLPKAKNGAEIKNFINKIK